MEDFINGVNFILFNIFVLKNCLEMLFPENQKLVLAVKVFALLFCFKFVSSFAYPLVLVVSFFFFGRWFLYPIFIVLAYIILSWQKSGIFSFMDEDRHTPISRPRGELKVAQEAVAPKSGKARACLQPPVTALPRSAKEIIPGLDLGPFGRRSFVPEGRRSLVPERQELFSMRNPLVENLQPQVTALAGSRFTGGMIRKEIEKAKASLGPRLPDSDSGPQTQNWQQSLFNREPLEEDPEIDISVPLATESLPTAGIRRRPKVFDFHRPMPRKKKPAP